MSKLVAWMDRHWRLVTVVVWLAFAAWFVNERWIGIQAFALGDTDDNLRMSQVRALLNGQDWYDLRQYKLNPPEGANVHWSRLVDLPIAGIMLAPGTALQHKLAHVLGGLGLPHGGRDHQPADQRAGGIE